MVVERVDDVPELEPLEGVGQVPLVLLYGEVEGGVAQAVPLVHRGPGLPQQLHQGGVTPRTQGMQN